MHCFIFTLQFSQEEHAHILGFLQTQLVKVSDSPLKYLSLETLKACMLTAQSYIHAYVRLHKYGCVDMES